MLELVQDELTELFHGTAERFGHEIVSMEIATDHVHLFVEADPKWSPAEIAKQFNLFYSVADSLENRVKSTMSECYMQPSH